MELYGLRFVRETLSYIMFLVIKYEITGIKSF